MGNDNSCPSGYGYDETFTRISIPPQHSDGDYVCIYCTPDEYSEKVISGRINYDQACYRDICKDCKTPKHTCSGEFINCETMTHWGIPKHIRCKKPQDKTEKPQDKTEKPQDKTE
mgnify:CR=1 FL=1